MLSLFFFYYPVCHVNECTSMRRCYHRISNANIYCNINMLATVTQVCDTCIYGWNEPNNSKGSQVGSMETGNIKLELSGSSVIE